MTPDIRQELASLQGERDGVALYTALAEVEKNEKVAEVYRRLAATEQHHASKWEKHLTEQGATIHPFQPSWRTRVLISLARRFGPGLVLPTVTAREEADSQGYSQTAGAEALAGDEQSHARMLETISQSTRGGMEGSALAQLEGRHRSAGGNALRAAVLGANDGLVSNLSLVMGVAGADLGGNSILVTGLAGLLAGAGSMALGEWLSVQSSRELYEKQIATEKHEIETNPEEEAEELALIYQSRGLEQAQARQLATSIIGNRANAIDTLAREELGINPEELGGSAWEAAITSFVLFALGAMIPVIPFLLFSGMTAVIVSVTFSTLGLFGIGAATSLFTGRTVLFSGMRMVIFGLAAAALVFAVGRLIGVSLGG